MKIKGNKFEKSVDEEEDFFAGLGDNGFDNVEGSVTKNSIENDSLATTKDDSDLWGQSPVPSIPKYRLPKGKSESSAACSVSSGLSNSSGLNDYDPFASLSVASVFSNSFQGNSVLPNSTPNMMTKPVLPSVIPVLNQQLASNNQVSQKPLKQYQTQPVQSQLSIHQSTTKMQNRRSSSSSSNHNLSQDPWASLVDFEGMSIGKNNSSSFPRASSSYDEKKCSVDFKDIDKHNRDFPARLSRHSTTDAPKTDDFSDDFTDFTDSSTVQPEFSTILDGPQDSSHELNRADSENLLF